MWGQHVKRRGRWWHYYRATPKAFCVVERRKVITFALRTSDVAQAKLQAAQISLDFDAAWADALRRGLSLCSQDAAVLLPGRRSRSNRHGLFAKTRSGNI
jgi:hypothetical protein